MFELILWGEVEIPNFTTYVDIRRFFLVMLFTTILKYFSILLELYIKILVN